MEKRFHGLNLPWQVRDIAVNFVSKLKVALGFRADRPLWLILSIPALLCHLFVTWKIVRRKQQQRQARSYSDDSGSHSKLVYPAKLGGMSLPPGERGPIAELLLIGRSDSGPTSNGSGTEQRIALQKQNMDRPYAAIAPLPLQPCSAEPPLAPSDQVIESSVSSRQQTRLGASQQRSIDGDCLGLGCPARHEAACSVSAAEHKVTEAGVDRTKPPSSSCLADSSCYSLLDYDALCCSTWGDSGPWSVAGHCAGPGSTNSSTASSWGRFFASGPPVSSMKQQRQVVDSASQIAKLDFLERHMQLLSDVLVDLPAPSTTMVNAFGGSAAYGSAGPGGNAASIRVSTSDMGGINGIASSLVGTTAARSTPITNAEKYDCDGFESHSDAYHLEDNGEVFAPGDQGLESFSRATTTANASAETTSADEDELAPYACFHREDSAEQAVVVPVHPESSNTTYGASAPLVGDSLRHIGET